MTSRLVLALLWLATIGAAPQRTLLALRLAAGERIVQHAGLVDRIDWRLPAARLEAFRAQGMVINEESHTTILATGVVIAADARAAKLRGDVTTTVFDVPRHEQTVHHDTGITEVTPRNVQVGAKLYALEDAPMIDLPAQPVELGSRWTTRQAVVTSLGSGVAVFQHVVASMDSGLVRIDVTGKGQITGTEYDLPHLLPGTIALRGSAWFDPASGLVVQESYAIDNTLVKTTRGIEIGFVEHLDADSDLHKEGPVTGRLKGQANRGTHG